jgi:predicted peroxiredoxin
MRTTVLLSAGDCWPLHLATTLQQTGSSVVVVLLDRGADLARPTHPSAARVREALDAGIELLVDTDALQRRGIHQADIATGLKPTDLSAVGDLLVDATDKVVWL